MEVREISAEVWSAEGEVILVRHSDMQALKARAAENVRHRVRLCAHRELSDPLHEMLIVLARGSYIRPHRHRGKSESFHVIEGEAEIVIFDEDGTPRQRFLLGTYGSGRHFYFRLDHACFHSVIVTSDAFVFHETTNGPFDRSDTEFAPWSPQETDIAEGNDFLSAILDRIEVSP